MNTNHSIHLVFHRFLMVLLALSALLYMAPMQPALADTQSNSITLNILTGTVSIDRAGNPPAEGARVTAWSETSWSAVPVHIVTVDSTGHYSLSLPGGMWKVTVLPPEISQTSPDWIYNGDPQLVTFNDTPDPANSTKTLDFSVSDASATLTGLFLAPVGSPAGTTFSGGNLTWVTSRNAQGDGNSVILAPDGTFSLHVLPGNVNLHVAFKNPTWAPPSSLAGAEWTLADGQTMDVGSFQVETASSTIHGTVLKLEGGAAAGIPVGAWRLDGTDLVKTTSAADGKFELALTPGVWDIRALPSDDTTANPYYIPVDPPKRVLVPSLLPINLHVTAADVTLNGQVVDKDGNPVQDAWGRVYAISQAEGKWIQFSQGAEIKAGQFILKLSTHIATQYKLHASFKGGYTSLDDPLVTVKPGVASVTLPVVPDNSMIHGTFVWHGTSTAAIGVEGRVYAASNSGAFAMDQIDPLTATYAVHVAASDVDGQGGTYWWLHAFVDPTSGVEVSRPRTEKVFIAYNNGQGEVKTGAFQNGGKIKIK